MIDHELTDPTGSALTITHNADGVWVTATQDHDEVTVGPFPTRTLRASFDMGDDLADGGVTAAAIEAEVVSPERARSLVQENTRLRERIGQAEEEMYAARRFATREHVRATRAEQERAATASPRPLSADDITDEMVVRAKAVVEEFAPSEQWPGSAARWVLEAALTPPPSRPEGAEELQALIRQAEAEGEGADNEALANYLAAHLTDPTVKEQS